MKEKIILTDVDGCLVDWNSAFDRFMEEKGHPMIPNGETIYNLSDRHAITAKMANEFVREFNEGYRIAHLNYFADSKEYVARLYSEGFKFIAITSLSSLPEAYTNRYNNLMNLFGNVFDEINCIEIGASKSFILQRWANTGYFWIEDHMRQAEAGYEVGLRTILISHPYNSHYQTDLFPRVSNSTPWKEIYSLISKEYNI